VVSFELGTWVCWKCGAKNYFPVSPDIIYLNGTMSVWDSKSSRYVEKQIKCFKCGAPYISEHAWHLRLFPLQPSSVKKVKCPNCGYEFEADRAYYGTNAKKEGSEG